MSAESKFWNWFKANEAKYFFLNQIEDEDEKENLLDDLLAHLHEYCDKLYFEVGGHPDEKQDLIITAEGDVDYFPQVEALVGSSPKLEHWTIIAFKPQTEKSVINYNGLSLDARNVIFNPLTNPNSQKIGVRLYYDNYTESNKKDLLTASYWLLDNVLGEKSYALNIGYVDVASVSTVQNPDDLIELVKLPKYIEWNKRQR